MIVKIPLEGGGDFVVESADDDAGGRVARGGRTVATSSQTFEGSMSTVRRIAEVVVDKLSTLAVGPDRITAEFGISLSAETGLAVVKGKGEAHFVISIEWSKEAVRPSPSPAAPANPAAPASPAAPAPANPAPPADPASQPS